MSGTLDTYQYVGSGLGNFETDSDTEIVAGGVQVVGYNFGTGVATGTTLAYGGIQDVGYVNGTGTAINTTIDNGAAQELGADDGIATAINTTIEAGGAQWVNVEDGASAVATDTKIFGTQIVQLGGVADDSIVYAGGLAIMAPGSAVDDAVIAGGTLELSSFSDFSVPATSVGGPINFATDTVGGTLKFVGAFSNFDFNSEIVGFTGEGNSPATSDAIDIWEKDSGDSLSWTQNGDSGVLSVADSSGAVFASLTLTGSYSQTNFGLTQIAQGYDQITYDAPPPCFRRGTLIATGLGGVEVERLRVGDLALTASGNLRGIVWIGFRDLDLERHPWPLEVMPVRVSRHAFGANAPNRDLWLSPQHAVFVEGALIPIICLVNGATIRQERADRVSYWHVELESHDVLLAEGLPVESFLDCGTRRGFANAAGLVELYPTFVPKTWEDAYAPLRESGPEVNNIRARLLARAQDQGFVRTRDPGLHVLADRRRIWPARSGAGVHVFTLPTGARDLRLISRSFRPADEAGADRRHLGVQVSRIAFDGAERDLGSMGAGWHDLERGGDAPWRWTDGFAALPPGAQQIVVTVGKEQYYWVADAGATSKRLFPGSEAPEMRLRATG